MDTILRTRSASKDDLETMITLIGESELGARYFKDDAKRLRRVLTQAIDDQEVRIGESEDGTCLGVMHLEDAGTFGKYPYLHMFVVAENARSLGVGRMFMDLMENEWYPNASKLFLMVGTWNPRALKFYEALGYKQCCVLEDFYVPGLAEILMVKIR